MSEAVRGGRTCPPRPPFLAVACLSLLATPLLPTPLQAQGLHRILGPTWTSDRNLVVVNAALGALTAGVSRWIRGEPVWEGVPAGAFGGAVGYAGRRLAMGDRDGAGLLGRQVNAVGASIVANSTRGEAPFEEIMLPMGPLHLYLGGEPGVDVRLDGRGALPGAAVARLSAARS